MLRFFQIVTTTALLWLTWMVFSADSMGKSTETDKKRRLSEQEIHRERTSELSVRGPNGQVSRQLGQLMDEVTAIGSVSGRVDFGSDDLPEEISAFLEGLNSHEIEILAEALVNPDCEIEDRGFWAYFLMNQFGRSDHERGLRVAKRLMDTNDPTADYLDGFVLMGWSSVAPQKAWEHFQKIRPTYETDYGTDFFVSTEIASHLLGEMAKLEPTIALEVVIASKPTKQSVSDWDFSAGISFESRDKVFQNLPDGMNWAKIAQTTDNCLFYPGQPGTAILVQGAGPELFVRWAEENPGEAIKWYTMERDVAELGVFDSDWEQLMNAWSRRSPESSSLWIEKQIATGERTKYQETLRSLFGEHTVHEATIRAARSFPDQAERFQVLKLAAHRESFDANRNPDPFATEQNPMSQEVDFVMNLIPGFNLSDSQEAEIKSIIAERDAEAE